MTDNKTIKLNDLIRDLQTSENKLIINGGWAAEIEAANIRGDKNITRNHGDLDILVREEDIPKWKEWFLNRGYKLSGNDGIKDETKAFVAHSPNSEYEWDENPEAFYVDVYGILIDDKGLIGSGETGQHLSWNMKWDDAFILCKWNENDVWVVKHEIVLKNKEKTAKAMGQELREKDLHDLGLFEKNND